MHLSRFWLLLRSGGRDLTSSGAFPRDFGRQIADQHLAWLDTCAQICRVLFNCSAVHRTKYLDCHWLYCEWWPATILWYTQDKHQDNLAATMPDLRQLVAHGFKDCFCFDLQNTIPGNKATIGAQWEASCCLLIILFPDHRIGMVPIFMKWTSIATI